MLNRLIPFVVKIKDKNPDIYHKIIALGKFIFKKRLGIYPRVLGNEVSAVKRVLRSSQWNMAYGKGLEHEKLEKDFTDFIKTPYAIAVGSGGMAIQMSLRALGIRPGDEVILQVDTCSATAFAIMNAGATPIFADICLNTFMLDKESILKNASPRTKAVLATHMWGNAENIGIIQELCQENKWIFIEDACLSLGTKVKNQQAGYFGNVGIFSFGCIKPIQGGEGGMIVTSDEKLAKELRAMRHWGDRTIDFGERDVTQLSFNGRMSEIVAAVVREQLKGYPKYLSMLQHNVANFAKFLTNVPEISIVTGMGTIQDSVYSQVVLKINPTAQISKQKLFDSLKEMGIPVWHANFELITQLSFFKQGSWEQWILVGDIDNIKKNYSADFPNAKIIYEALGIGLGKMNFLSKGNLSYLKENLSIALKEAKNG